MAAEALNPQESTRSLRRTETASSTETLTPEEEFLDDIREGLRELQEGEALFDSRQRLKELRKQSEHGSDPS